MSHKKKYFYIPLAVGGIILAIWYGVWLQGAKLMKETIVKFADDETSDTSSLTFNSIKVSGFPFFLRGKVDAPVYTTANGLNWSGEKLYMDADIISPSQLTFSPRGDHIISDATGDTWHINDDSARASFEALLDGRWVVKLAGDRMKATQSTGETVHVLDYLINVQPSKELENAVEASILVGAAALDGGLYEGNPIKLDGIEFAARLHAISLAKTDTIQEWKAAGGHLEIQRAAIFMDDALFSLRGNISIDREGFPTGAVNALVEKPAKLAPLFVGLGQLSNEEADAARSGLMVVGLATGGKINGPIEMKNGAAHLLDIQIARLPQVTVEENQP